MPLPRCGTSDECWAKRCGRASVLEEQRLARRDELLDRGQRFGGDVDELHAHSGEDERCRGAPLAYPADFSSRLDARAVWQGEVEVDARAARQHVDGGDEDATGA